MDVNYYLYHFANLHTAKVKGKPAPHKAVLLLAVMRLIEKGQIAPKKQNQFEVIQLTKWMIL